MDQSLQYMFVFISIHLIWNKKYRHIFYHKFSQVKRNRDLIGTKHLEPGRKWAWSSAHCMLDLKVFITAYVVQCLVFC